MFLQTIRIKLANLYFVLPLCCLFLFVTSEASAAPLSKVNYSGEELFQGIFFATGPVADQIPELQGLNARALAKSSKELNDVIHYQNSLMEKVRKQSPGYFSELEKSVQSKNPRTIKSTVEKGAFMLREIAAEDGYKVTAKDQLALEREFQQYQMGNISSDEMQTAIEKYRSTTTSEIGGPVALVAIYFVVVLWVFVVVPVIASPDGELYNERLASSLSQL